MIYGLRGTVKRLAHPHVTVDVGGVQYLVAVPHPVWTALEEGAATELTVFTYVREDRLDLFGFMGRQEREFFAALLNLDNVGPKLALELCSVPRHLLTSAVLEGDVSILTAIKGVGKKTGEKLLLDLKNLFEKHVEWMAGLGGDAPASLDRDAVLALTSLGYDQPSVLAALKSVPGSVKRTEDRVAAALRSL